MNTSIITGMTIKEIYKALIYCKHKDGALCGMCPYSKYGGSGRCSSLLLDDAAKMLNSLEHLVKDKENMK